ncbi:MAG: hypothetical protein AB7I50_21035 [Vicinamibacterales bacterium]
MNVLLTALLGVLVGWYLRHVLASSKLAELQSTWQANARTWSDERDSLLVTAADLSKRSSELEIELGTTTASFTRQIEQTGREHASEITHLRARVTTLERERDDVGRQLSDVARKSAALDRELRATLARHRSRTAGLEEQVAAIRQERDNAARERDDRQRHLSELTRRAAATEAELHVRITLLESRLRQLMASREAVPPARPAAAVDLRQEFPRLAAQAASVLAAWQERTHQLDGQLHALLDQSQAHRVRYQKHLDAIRHELNAAQQRLDSWRPSEPLSISIGRVASGLDPIPRPDSGSPV